MSISWSRLLHSCARLPFAAFLQAIPNEVDSVESCDVWLWDHQRRTLSSLTTGSHATDESALSTVPQTKFTLVTPIVYQGEELGFLTLSGATERPRNSEDLALFIGTALRANEATTDLINISRRRRDMSLPAEMQWALLPPTQFTLPDGSLTAAVEPAYDTGGDVFDYSLDADTLFLAVLDARGHGLRAATTATVATSAMRLARRNGKGLQEIASEITTSVVALGDEQEFVSAILIELDLATWTGSWLSAGHLPPLIVGDDVRPLPLVPALPLGMTIGGAISQPSTQSLALPAGKALTLYSDGIIENVTLDVGDPLGDERFHAALRNQVRPPPAVEPSHAARSVVDELLGLTGTVLRDDATLMVVQRT